MRSLFLSLALFIITSCGGLDLGMKSSKAKPETQITSDVSEKYAHLQILKIRFQAKEETLNQVVVKNLILELEHHYPQLIHTRHELKLPEAEILKNPAFRSLELTVEHLSHRESVKFKSSRSASLSRL